MTGEYALENEQYSIEDLIEEHVDYRNLFEEEHIDESTYNEIKETLNGYIEHHEEKIDEYSGSKLYHGFTTGGLLATFAMEASHLMGGSFNFDDWRTVIPLGAGLAIDAARDLKDTYKKRKHTEKVNDLKDQKLELYELAEEYLE